MRMLLRGPDRSGVLLRQRCTSRLRRWASRLQQQNAQAIDSDLDQGRTCEGDLAFDQSQSCVGDLAYSSDGHVISHVSGDEVRASKGMVLMRYKEHQSRMTWHPHDALQESSGTLGPLAQSATEYNVPGSFTQIRSRRLSFYHPSSMAADIRLDGSGCQPAGHLQRRSFSSSAGEDASNADGKKESIHVTFINRDGSEKTIQVPIGTHMLQAAHDNDIDLEGACEASLACSTCHVIFEEEGLYNRLPEPSEEENDMLDLAFGLTPTSRLGCQVLAIRELDGVRLRVPASTEQGAVARLNV